MSCGAGCSAAPKVAASVTRNGDEYAGPKFGGPNHRLRSAGHDVARPLEALRQIRTGEFRGYYWDNGVRHEVRVPRYQPVESLGEALTLWGKHLVADVVTHKGLPPPG